MLLASDHYSIDQKVEHLLEYVNLALTSIFFIEMAIKMIGIGIHSYLKDRSNVLDMIIVIISILDLGIFIYVSNANQ